MFVSLFHINWYDYSSDSNGISDHHQYWWPLIRVFSFWIKLFEWLTFKYTQELMESNKSMDLAFLARMRWRRRRWRENCIHAWDHIQLTLFFLVFVIFISLMNSENSFWCRRYLKCLLLVMLRIWKLIWHRFWIGRCIIGEWEKEQFLPLCIIGDSLYEWFHFVCMSVVRAGRT